MTLLAPMAAIIAAAIAFPALFILYLLKLRRRPVRVSSTLLWQQAYEDLEANIPWRWVRPSWLVLLHALLVGLLVLAIGRPAIHAGGPNAARLVFIVDCSASMSARDGRDGASRLEEAKQRAITIIDESMRFGRRMEAAIITVAAEAQGLCPLTSDRRLLRETIAAIGPTDQPLDLQSAFKLAEAVLGKRDTSGSESNEPEESAPLIVVLSDGSLPPGEPLSISGAAVRLESVGPPPPVALESPDAAAIFTGHENLGIIALSARRDPDNPATVRIFTQLQNALARARDVPIVLSLGGVERERRAVQLPPATSVAPGTRSASFELQTRDAGVLTLAIGGEDLLPADDRASLLLASPRAPAILLVTPDQDPASAATSSGDAPPDGDPPPQPAEESLTPAWLLESILSELRPASLRSVRASEAESLVRSALGVYDLIVFDRVAPASIPPVPSLHLGAGIPALGIGVSSPSTDSPAKTDMLDRDFVLSWERAHPLLRDVTLDTVFALGPAAIIPSALPPGSVQPPAVRSDLVLGATGPMMSLFDAGGVRHIVLAFDLVRSNWSLQVGFAIFLANSVDFLTLRPGDETGGVYRTATSIDAVVPSSISTLTLTGPARREIHAPLGGLGGASPERTVSLGRLEHVGIYTIQPTTVRPATLAVNLLDPVESALATSAELTVRTRAAGGAAADAISIPEEIGHYILLAVLALLAIEWIIYTRTARV